MKNKLLAMICICVLAVSMLAACGSSSQDAATTDSTDTTQEDSGTETIKIDPEYVVVDDDNLKMTVTSISYEEYSEDHSSYTVHYTVENKRDDVEIRTDVAADAASVGGYSVIASNMSSDTMPGTINDMGGFVIDSYDASFEHITKLEDLMTFKAKVEITLSVDKGDHNEIEDRYTVNLSIADR